MNGRVRVLKNKLHVKLSKVTHFVLPPRAPGSSHTCDVVQFRHKRAGEYFPSVEIVASNVTSLNDKKKKNVIKTEQPSIPQAHRHHFDF